MFKVNTEITVIKKIIKSSKEEEALPYVSRSESLPLPATALHWSPRLTRTAIPLLLRFASRWLHSTFHFFAQRRTSSPLLSSKDCIGKPRDVAGGGTALARLDSTRLDGKTNRNWIPIPFRLYPAIKWHFARRPAGQPVRGDTLRPADRFHSTAQNG